MRCEKSNFLPTIFAMMIHNNLCNDVYFKKDLYCYIFDTKVNYFVLYA